MNIEQLPALPVNKLDHILTYLHKYIQIIFFVSVDL